MRTRLITGKQISPSTKNSAVATRVRCIATVRWDREITSISASSSWTLLWFARVLHPQPLSPFPLLSSSMTHSIPTQPNHPDSNNMSHNTHVSAVLHTFVEYNPTLAQCNLKVIAPGPSCAQGPRQIYSSFMLPRAPACVLQINHAPSLLSCAGSQLVLVAVFCCFCCWIFFSPHHADP